MARTGGARARRGPAPAAGAVVDSALEELRALAKRSGDLSDLEAKRYQRAVGMLLRETAEVARNVGGAVPSTWAHYMFARRAFESDAKLAETLGVNRSRVARWKQGAAADPENEARLRDIGVAAALLMDYLEPRAIQDWLHGTNAHLGHRRPVDVLRSGRLSEVVAAIEAEKAGAFA